MGREGESQREKQQNEDEQTNDLDRGACSNGRFKCWKQQQAIVEKLIYLFYF